MLENIFYAFLLFCIAMPISFVGLYVQYRVLRWIFTDIFGLEK